MTIGSHSRSTTQFSISDGKLTIFWKYPVIGSLLSAITILFAIWVSKGFAEWGRRHLRLLKFASKLPGPPALPLLGNALRFACHPDELLNRIVEVCKGYKTPFRFWLGPKLLVVLTDPRDIQIILNSSKAAYKGQIYSFFKPMIGCGLVSGSGPTHRSHRRVIMPMLNGKVVDAYMEYFDKRSMICVDLLDKLVDTGEFDVHPFMEHCTFDIILDTIMGTPGTAQEEGYKELVEWSRRIYELIHSRMMKVWLHPDWIFSRTNSGEQQKIGMRVIHGFTESLIDRKRKEHNALERGSIATKRPRLMLLEQLIAHTEKSKVMDDVQLRDEIYTVFTAAHDTTATISSFVFMMLGMHPKIQDKLREELSEVLGKSHVTTEALAGLKYLDMVIKETLRLFPIAPFMVRELKGDVELETITLPEGCSIVMAAYMTHRDPKHWLNPEEFNPDRFSPENSTGRHPFAYIPFSSGLRGCIGKKYAMMCLKTFVANVVRRYRLECKGTLDKLRLKTDISIRSVEGYKLSITAV